ncbi:hypothetical protein Hanom_Chr10g00958421 [Helianthus anomalus]
MFYLKKKNKLLSCFKKKKKRLPEYASLPNLLLNYVAPDDEMKTLFLDSQWESVTFLIGIPFLSYVMV